VEPEPVVHHEAEESGSLFARDRDARGLPDRPVLPEDLAVASLERGSRLAVAGGGLGALRAPKPALSLPVEVVPREIRERDLLRLPPAGALGCAGPLPAFGSEDSRYVGRDSPFVPAAERSDVARAYAAVRLAASPD
jgi:hypothetical protein